jgi:hypothetical protein
MNPSNLRRPWTDNDRTKLAVRFFDGLSYAEMAEEFGRTVNGIKSTLSGMDLIGAGGLSDFDKQDQRHVAVINALGGFGCQRGPFDLNRARLCDPNGGFIPIRAFA